MKCRINIPYSKMPWILALFYPKVFFIIVNNVYIQEQCFDVKVYYRDFMRKGKI